MSNGLNNIQLNNTLLASLYGHSLVANNKRIVLVLVKTTPTTQQHSFLWQILGACKLTPNEVVIVDASLNKQPLEVAVDEHKPDYFISFGGGSGKELFSLANIKGTQYLNAPALDELMQENESSKLLKRKTWNELRQMFGI